MVLKTVEYALITVTRVTMLIAASHGHKYYALFAFSAELKDPQSGPRRLIIVKRLGEGGWLKVCVGGGGGDVTVSLITAICKLEVSLPQSKVS